MQLLGTGIQRAGKTSQVEANSTVLNFASYSVEEWGDDLQTVNFGSYNVAEDATFDEGILGVQGARCRFGGDWDAGQVPTANPPGLFPRDDLPNLTLTPDRNDPDSWVFSYFRLRGTNQGSTTKGKVTFDCSGMNQGVYTRPLTSV